MDDLSTLFSLNNWPGHLSYILIAISYWLTDIFWLRVVAVVGLSLEILYFLLSGGDLRTGIGWDLVFILINLYQIYRLVQDRLSLRLPEKDRELLRRVLTGLSDAQIARLLNAGALCDLPADTKLEVEDITTDIYTIVEHDPLSATVRCERWLEYQRGDWQVRLETTSTMTGDTATFHVTNLLDAYEGNTRIFTKTWTFNVPRDFV
jgi:hypothetical protein